MKKSNKKHSKLAQLKRLLSKSKHNAIFTLNAENKEVKIKVFVLWREEDCFVMYDDAPLRKHFNDKTRVRLEDKLDKAIAKQLCYRKLEDVA